MDECKESKCGSHGPAVRFPFQIKGQRPDHCGYPETGFDLSCSERQDTVLELPNSTKLLVKKIDYVSQVIYASDPRDCLPRQLSNMNLSASSFQFWAWTSTITSCSTVHEEEIHPISIRCLVSMLLDTKFMYFIHKFPRTTLTFCILPRCMTFHHFQKT
ncbi:hypothetical protein P3X46_000577 [Hevea brasiliensis]|uniref:RING-type E3 ubiquitin transferase n=1 Tax=Hevea brasiliensis TaxID=3981 RepID=A0ABQ9N9R3_HEVBR|nr:hypothetical protein P3X46_000577 [Hevea brasiliensis]